MDWLRQTLPILERESDGNGQYWPIPPGSGPILFLNAQRWYRFSRCPECDEKTKLRVFNVTVMVEPDALLNVRMQSPFCPNCDLLVLHLDSLYEALEKTLESTRPELIGNDVMVRGLIDNTLIRQRPGDDTEQQWIDQNTRNFRSSKVYVDAWSEANERGFREISGEITENPPG
jgi:hypothetical protein